MQAVFRAVIERLINVQDLMVNILYTYLQLFNQFFMFDQVVRFKDQETFDGCYRTSYLV